MNEGRIEVKAKRVQFGRKPKINRDRIIEMKKQGIGATQITKEMGIGRSKVYKILNKKQNTQR